MKYLALAIAVFASWVTSYGQSPVEKQINKYTQGSHFAAFVYRNKVGDIMVLELANRKEPPDLFHYLTDGVFKKGLSDTAVIFLYEKKIQSAFHQPVDTTFTHSEIFYKVPLRDGMYFPFDELYSMDEVTEVILSKCNAAYYLKKRNDGKIVRYDTDKKRHVLEAPNSGN